MDPLFLSPLKSTFFTFLSIMIFFSCQADDFNKKPRESSVLERWDGKNNPLEVMDSSYVTQFKLLPMSGQTLFEPWSDSYWPNNFGGISQRWNGYQGDQFTYQLASFDRVKKMSLKEIAILSPAEKYDIFMGRFDYPFVSHERKRTSPQALSWEGLCHGWAPAAINYREPAPVIMKSPDGIEVPFGSSDIKGLLTFLQATDETPRVRFLGTRCNKDFKKTPRAALLKECQDLNAGAFHMVLANEIGIRKKAFIIDKTRDLEVWNQPVYRYVSRIEGQQRPSTQAAPGTVREILVQSEISYSIESVTLWSRVLGTEYFNYDTVSYRYRLELDASDQIIGGEWLEEARPDFLWTKDPSPMGGIFEPLERIYRASLVASPMVNPLEGP
jgi:hypothetical protein